jgi:hypothetical protein
LIFHNNKPCNVRHLVGTWCDSLMCSWGNGQLRPNFQPNWC